MSKEIRVIFSELEQLYRIETTKSVEEPWELLTPSAKFDPRYEMLKDAIKFARSKGWASHKYVGVFRKQINGDYHQVDTETQQQWMAKDRAKAIPTDKSLEAPRQRITRLTISAFDREGLTSCAAFPVADDTGDPLAVLDKIKKKILEIVHEEGEADLNFGVGTVITILVQ